MNFLPGAIVREMKVVFVLSMSYSEPGGLEDLI